MNGDSKNAHFPAGTMDSKRYFAPVCDQDFLEQVDLHQHDEWVAELKLETMGVGIDTLTPEQEKYLASWQEGT